ncbi:MAG: Hpt domain-containing protein [Acidobacteriota bacterium]|nr:MAG: Hpt domain-containing protein [Acidobacteriota bacterium]
MSKTDSRVELYRVFVEDAGRHLAAARGLVADDTTPSSDQIAALFRHLHSVKGMALSLGLDQLARSAHEAEEIVERARSGSACADGEFVRVVRARLSELAAAYERLAAVPEQPSRRGGELTTTGRWMADLPAVTVDPARLDRLLDLTLRLSAEHDRLEHQLGPQERDVALFRVREALAETVSSLRFDVLELRLLPVRALVPLLEGALRRWAGQCGVRLAFAARGDALRLDRAILERMLDPLGHLLRNAVVHGLESPETRAAAGKPERGRVELEIRRGQDRLLFEVRDDGRGIRSDEVIGRARERALLDADESLDDGESEHRALMLLTRPGMSSQKVADALSGRGIGLAAVRTEIERLGGELWLESEPQRGFRARIAIPARLSVMEVFLVMAGGERFALPLAAISRVVPRDEPRAPRDGAIELDLDACLGLRAEAPASRAKSGAALPCQPAALEIDSGGLRATVRVDAVEERREVIVRPLGPPLDRVPPWIGAALLADGSLALVLDPHRLIRTVAREAATMSR